MSGINRDSPYYTESRDRKRINVALWNDDANSRDPNAPRCNTCISHPRLIIKEIVGVKKYWCHECGHTVEIEPTNSPSQSNSKYTNKYGVSQGRISSFIISKGKKKSKSGELTEEDKSLLGSSSAGATLIDSRESTFSEGGWSG